MSTERPPSIDPQAAARWAAMPVSKSATSPWLHEEVARRMEQRLEWIVQKPATWVHWQPVVGGLQAHALLTQRYPKSACFVLEAQAERAQTAHKLIAKPWWSPARWKNAAPVFAAPTQAVQMVWANMALHNAPDPQALIAQWHKLLAVDGFLMFSCLGPDTVRELRALYAQKGWGSPSHEFTDMHDWGDMLVHAGFAEPVMDMERITLSFSSPQTLIAELRELGRNLHSQRFNGLRGRAWLRDLQAAMDQGLRPSGGERRLQLSFEIIYGHAFKPVPRLPVAPQTAITLDEMRQALQKGKSTNA